MAEVIFAPALRVLIVDRCVDHVLTLAHLLRLWGHEVRSARDGASALEAARSFRPQVVLLEIGLPGMNGWEVARTLRQQCTESERFLLVAITGFGLEEDRRRSREAGFDHHLVKPGDPEELHRLLIDSPGRCHRESRIKVVWHGAPPTPASQS